MNPQQECVSQMAAVIHVNLAAQSDSSQPSPAKFLPNKHLQSLLLYSQQGALPGVTSLLYPGLTTEPQKSWPQQTHLQLK